MDSKILEFAVKKAGGEEELKKEFYREEMKKTLRKARTFEDLVKLAEDEELEWSEAVYSLSKAELVDILGGGGSKKAATKTTVSAPSDQPRRRKRLTREEVEKLRAEIVETFKASKRKMMVGELADDLAQPNRVVAMQLRSLREQGVVGMEGERWNARYFLA